MIVDWTSARDHIGIIVASEAKQSSDALITLVAFQECVLNVVAWNIAFGCGVIVSGGKVRSAM